MNKKRYGERSVTLRPAKPDYDEGLQFANYLDQAAEGFFRFMLGQNSARIIASAFVEPGHTLSWENVLFAEVDNRIVGMSSTFTAEQHRKFSDEPLQKAAKLSAIRMKLVRIIFAPLWRILETIPEGDFYIQAIAVDPDLRGSGVGSLMMSEIESRGKAVGSSRLSLDVSAKNTGAQKLYQRLGMVDSSCWPESRFLPTVFIRMAKCL